MKTNVDSLDLSRVVVCCSGPSLLEVNPNDLGWPTIAISTAIRNPHLKQPTVWVFADRPNPNHGPARNSMLDDPAVLKIVPSWVFSKSTHRRRRPQQPVHGVNILPCEYVRNRKVERELQKQGRHYMDGKTPILRDTHKSVTFALGWLSTVGTKEIWVCGNDLMIGKRHSQKYGYELKPGDRRLRHMVRSLAATESSLRRYCRDAERAGIRIVAWGCGRKFRDMAHDYVPSTYPRCYQEIADATAAERARSEGWDPAPL